MALCLKCRVSGDVQGVFYRASARHEAEQLKVTGYAKNLRDGSVEVLACGEKESVDNFCAWLSKGPSQAKVTHVSCEVVDVDCPAVFSVE